MPPTSALRQWGELMVEAAEKGGRKITSAHHYEQQMRDAGYVDVKLVKNIWPVNSWPKNPLYKELGQWNMVNTLQGLHGLSMALFTRALGWSPVHNFQTFHSSYSRVPQGKTYPHMVFSACLKTKCPIRLVQFWLTSFCYRNKSRYSLSTFERKFETRKSTAIGQCKFDAVLKIFPLTL